MRRSTLATLNQHKTCGEDGADGVKIERINPGAHWTQIVIHGDIVYLVGTTAKDTSQDVKGQTKQVLSTIDELLAKAGTDKSKLLTAQIWLRDISDWSKMNEVWDAWVAPGNAPTRATVEVLTASSRSSYAEFPRRRERSLCRWGAEVLRCESPERRSRSAMPGSASSVRSPQRRRRSVGSSARPPSLRVEPRPTLKRGTCDLPHSPRSRTTTA